MNIRKKLLRALGDELEAPNADIAAKDGLLEAISRAKTLSDRIGESLVSMAETAAEIRAEGSAKTEFAPIPAEAPREDGGIAERSIDGSELARNVALAANELGRQLNSKIVR